MDCRKCETLFTLFQRRHHCRWCGFIFCNTCTPYRLSLSSYSLFKDRLCQDCFTFLSSHDSPLPHLVPPMSPTRSSLPNRSSLSGSILNECPVCQLNLNRPQFTEEDIARHVSSCLDKVSANQGQPPIIAGNMYVVQKLSSDLQDIECSICFEEFLKTQEIARLNCLCFYHKKCIDAWLTQTGYGVRACPVHYS
jgi:hypothetical protein